MCVLHSLDGASLDCAVNITVILAKHCIELRDDGSLVIRNMLEQF